MSPIQALLLGLVQGLTEFLPVSSSGHLEIVKALFGLELSGNESLTFDVVVHLGTALSTIVVFRKEIGEIVAGLLKFAWNDETKFASFILLSMVPAGFIGLGFEDEISTLFEGQLLLIAATLTVTGLLLFLADRAKTSGKPVNAVEAVIIGLAQAIAILPGISRSGSTIATSVLLGIDREKAAKFSFLMVLPIILGKAMLDAKDIISGEALGAEVSTLSLLLGLSAAFFSGILACNWMIALVKRAKLRYFSYYCFAIAIIVVITQFI
ncbi:MAG: undecaprenyl-diphosphate phosphatase [Schleiferiaceae bacterium]|mgnify:FL=1|jgi:undecaprenyl-diphosphatase|nr:undecaprenyl-diphosphate phosphatase [Schleiferiaceae bacterium]